MPINIIAQNRIAGILKIHGLPSTNNSFTNICFLSAFCPFCFLACFLCLNCCPFCSFEFGDCGKSDKNSSGCCNCDCCNSDKKCPCCDENKCSFALCEKSKCPCCVENRCCCGLCEKSKGPCSCCCCCNCNSNSASQNIKYCCAKLNYHREILSPNKELKYNIYLNSHICGNKCLRRRKGLDFFIAEANNN